jgi:two-component system, OmpR family, response regulator MtrA
LKALVADNDSHHLDTTAHILRREGFQVLASMDGREALRKWETEQPDVVLLETRIPTIGGFDVLRTIRQSSPVPVILLSERADEANIVRGLHLGADDYIAKPFNPRELVARIHTVLRRSQNGHHNLAAELEAASLALSVESHEARRGDLRVRLTPLEFRLLYQLMQNCGRIVSSIHLIEQAWGYESGDPGMLKTHISHIRKKLCLKPGESGYIQGIRSLGYILQP